MRSIATGMPTSSILPPLWGDFPNEGPRGAKYLVNLEGGGVAFCGAINFHSNALIIISFVLIDLFFLLIL